MKKLITISREYGSGGRMIGKLIAKELSVPFYDKEIIDAEIEKRGYSREMLESAEIKAKNGFSYSISAALSKNSFTSSNNIPINEKIFLEIYDVIRDICEEGEGVIVGRCADYILGDVPGVTNVFFYADANDRVDRAIEEYGIDRANAKKVLESYDKGRHNYYKYHTGRKWGDCQNYNLMINTSYISTESVVALVADYVRNRKY